MLVPLPIVKGIKEGYKILLYASIKTRVERIKEDYLKTDANIEQLKHSISLLKKHLGVKKIEESIKS